MSATGLGRTVFAGAASIVAALAVSSDAVAHHSQVLFDMNKCLTLSGTVRTWQFESPHSWLWVVVPNAKGSTDVWGFEASSPAQMIEAEHRWKRDIVRPLSLCQAMTTFPWSLFTSVSEESTATTNPS